MRKLTVFNNISLDGHFAAPDGDLSWAHAGSDDPEFSAFTADNAQAGGMLVLGRRTYELMASFWPTPLAAEQLPVLAERMNSMPKLVCSRTLEQAAWSNTTLLRGDLAGEIRKRKAEAGPDMSVLGSGSIVAQLAQAGLVDEYHLVLNPIALGWGRSLFDGLGAPLNLRLMQTRSFANGKLWLSYVPAA